MYPVLEAMKCSMSMTCLLDRVGESSNSVSRAHSASLYFTLGLLVLCGLGGWVGGCGVPGWIGVVGVLVGGNVGEPSMSGPA